MRLSHRFSIFSILASFLISTVFAESIIDTNMTSLNSVNDIVVNTPYLDTNLWILITLLGLGFLILSNIAGKDQAATLWAIIAPLFLLPSAYFCTMMSTASTAVNYYGINQTFVQRINIITHPEWLALVMGVIFIISLVNIWMVATKNPIEKTKKEEFMGK